MGVVRIFFLTIMAEVEYTIGLDCQEARLLRFNEKNNSFILFSDGKEQDKAAKAAGLTLSTSVRGPGGEKVFFTSDAKRLPSFNPYAVLDWYDEADASTQVRMESLRRDYEASWAKDTTYVAPAPEGKTPMPFQNAGVEYCLGKTHSVIADEMGLGKTIQAILLANALDARRILVVCPASIRRNWRKEIFEWTTLRRPSVEVVESGRQGINPAANFTVISYDLLRNPGIHAALRATQFDLAIFDEAHYMKSVNAQRTRAVFGGGEKPKFGDKPKYSFYNNGLDRNIKRMVGLTGTPVPNRPREAYTLARGLDWEAIDFLSHDAFVERYNPSGYDGDNRWESKGRLPELQARLRCNFMVRRLKADVLPQLPDKRYEMTYIEPNGAIRDVLAREALIDFNPAEIFSKDFSIGDTPISTLRREMGEAMVPRVVEYVREMMTISEVQKIILYAHHKSVIAGLHEGLDGQFGVVIQKGGMSDGAKETARNDFISGRPRIFLGQLDTMEGVDGLQSVCRNVVFAEPAWNPGRNEQCVDRAHRIGQHDNVLAHFLLVEGSFNEKVLNIVLSKAGNIHETLDRRVV
jgi:SWI/SNF-related matrix-associated actin-dependent regulator 1 of chromatin subfamily A